jgi:hypothetical protein
LTKNIQISLPNKNHSRFAHTANGNVGKKMDGQFIQGSESCNGFGTVNTFVQYMGEVKEQQRDALLRIASSMPGMFPAMIEQQRHSIPHVGLMQRIGFVFKIILSAPMMAILYAVEAPYVVEARHIVATPRRLPFNRTRREDARVQQTGGRVSETIPGRASPKKGST